MRITFGDSELSVLQWSDDADFESFLDGCDAGHLVLGTDSERTQQLHTVTVHLGSSGRRLGIGIRAETHGLFPGLLLREDLSELWIGFNREVAGVVVTNGKLRFRLRLDSLFHRFVRVNGTIVVLLEAGVMGLGANGAVQWQHATDLIERWSLAAGKVRLEFMDTDPAELKVSSGALKALTAAETLPSVDRPDRVDH